MPGPAQPRWPVSRGASSAMLLISVSGKTPCARKCHRQTSASVTLSPAWATVASGRTEQVPPQDRAGASPRMSCPRLVLCRMEGGRTGRDPRPHLGRPVEVNRDTGERPAGRLQRPLGHSPTTGQQTWCMLVMAATLPQACPRLAGTHIRTCPGG